MAPNHLRKFRAFVISGTIFSTLAVIAVLVSVVTNNWQVITVDRETLSTIAEYIPNLEEDLENNGLYFSRTRGILFTCSSRNSAGGFQQCQLDPAFSSSSDVTVGENVALAFQVNTRNKMLIAILATGCVSAFCEIIAAIIAVIGYRKGLIKMMMTSLGFAFLATASAGVAMALYHGVDYMEQSKINLPNFPAGWKENDNFEELRSHTDISEGYSYFLGWIAMLFCCVSAVLYLHAGNRLRLAQRRMSKTRKQHHSRKADETMSKRSSAFKEPPTLSKVKARPDISVLSLRNKAYDMIETSVTPETTSSRDSASDKDWNPYDHLPEEDILGKK